jgi:hypothetical protein
MRQPGLFLWRIFPFGLLSAEVFNRLKIKWLKNVKLKQNIQPT